MESKINYLIEKIDKIDEKLDIVLEHNRNTDVTLAKQEVQIAYHIKRTDLLEQEIKPLKNHTTMTQAIIKVSSVALTGVGVMFGIYKIIMHFL